MKTIMHFKIDQALKKEAEKEVFERSQVSQKRFTLTQLMIELLTDYLRKKAPTLPNVSPSKQQTNEPVQ
jgi:hypothetical protein